MTPTPLPPERLEEIRSSVEGCHDPECVSEAIHAGELCSGCRESLLLSHIAYLEGEVEKLEKPSAWRVLRYFYQRGIAPRQLVTDAFGEMNVHILRGLVHELCEFANFYPNGPRQTPDPSEPGA